MNNLQFHPLANIFPLLQEAELKDLAEDIRTHGLKQPIWLYEGKILDGRNRYQACNLVSVCPRFETFTGESPVGFVISLNLKRRHLTPSQAATAAVEVLPFLEEEAAKRIGGRPKKIGDYSNELPRMPIGKPPQKIAEVSRNINESREKVASLFNTNRQYVSDAKAIKERAPEKFEEIKNGNKTIPQVKKEMKAESDMEDLQEAQRNITDEKRKSLEAVCDLRVCSCRDLFASGIKPDAVITDPPYPREFLPVFTELAESCKAAGVPLVAVMSGQSYLPDVMQRLCESLSYRWTLAYMTPGGQSAQQWQAKVNSSWKPVLLFGEAAEWFGDVATSRPNDNDKRFHGWGQSESGMADLIDRLTKPGQLICDPFLGGGTTAVVSLAMGRRFVGCDIDPDCVNKARMRVQSDA